MGFTSACRRISGSVTLSAALFVLALSLAVAMWAYATPHDWFDRELRMAPLFAAALAWAILCAAIGRKRQWDPTECRHVAGATMAATCIVLFLIAQKPAFGGLAGCSPLAGLFCRKLVYPDLEWKSDDRPETLSIR